MLPLYFNNYCIRIIYVLYRVFFIDFLSSTKYNYLIIIIILNKFNNNSISFYENNNFTLNPKLIIIINGKYISNN